MTLKELQERVDWAMANEQNHNARVCIPNNKEQFGQTPCTDVDHAAMGIDWNSQLFMIWPNQKMTNID